MATIPSPRVNIKLEGTALRAAALGLAINSIGAYIPSPQEGESDGWSEWYVALAARRTEDFVKIIQGDGQPETLGQP